MKLKELKSILKTLNGIRNKLVLSDQQKYLHQIDDFEQKLLFEIASLEFDEALTLMLETEYNPDIGELDEN